MYYILTDTYLEKLNGVFNHLGLFGGKMELSNGLIVTLEVEDDTAIEKHIRLSLSRMIDGTEHEEAHFKAYVYYTIDPEAIKTLTHNIPTKETSDEAKTIHLFYGLFGQSSDSMSPTSDSLESATDKETLTQKIESILDRITENEIFSKPKILIRYKTDKIIYDSDDL